MTVNEILRRIGRSERTARRVVAAGRGLPPLAVSPRKPVHRGSRKTSKSTDRLLNRELLKDPRLTAAHLKKSYPKLFRNVSERTVPYKIQKGQQLPTFKPVQKPLLTKAMVKKRLGFAKKYMILTKEQW